MRHRTSSAFASRIRNLAHLVSERMNQSANQRLNSQLGNSPIAVLGVA